MFTALHEWGIALVLWFQRFSPGLDLPFRLITFLGQAEFYLLVFPILYWLIDRDLGARLSLLFVISLCINALAKGLAGQPRPFTYSPQVQMLYEATGGGFPSGHTQNTVAVWGYLASEVGSAGLWVLAALLMLLIPLSRVYLGVHFPSDLLGGYLLGFLLLILYRRLGPRLGRWLKERPLAVQLLIAGGAPLLILLFLGGLDPTLPPSAGILLGLSTGLVLERRHVRMSVRGSLHQRLGRLVVSTLSLAALYFAYRQVEANLTLGLAAESVFYALVGLLVGFVGPWCFVKLGLASQTAANPAESDQD